MCMDLILQLSILSTFNCDRCSFRCFSVNAALPLSTRIVGFEIITLQFGRVVNISFFNCNKSSKIYLEVLDTASLVPTCTII